MFYLSDQERRSFLGADPRFGSIDGPISLARLIDSRRGRSAIRGRYWMYASEISDILEGGLHLIREVSERWAICDDWGDCGRMVVMHVPARTHVEAWVGFAKYQPKVSAATQRSTGRRVTNSYAGGSIQLVMDITEREVRWMKGPYFTRQLSQKHLHQGA